MGKIAQELHIDFIISTGDNFYEDGLNETGDPSFEQSFSAIYSASSLRRPWHLGNCHHYHTSFGYIYLGELGTALSTKPCKL